MPTSSSNPIAPPPAPAYAGFVSRAAALVLDLLFISFASAAVTWLLKIVFQLPGVNTLWDVLGILPDEGTASLSVATGLLAQVIYFTAFWSIFGQTIGMAALGLTVRQANGRAVGAPRAGLRYLSFVVSTLPLFLGWLWCLADRRHQAWHDKIAGTVVVRAPRGVSLV